MHELIAVNYDSDKPTVSGRELHRALGIGTKYNDWFSRMREYGFTEGNDFYSILSESTGGRRGVDHLLTVPMAKELCMLQRTPIGKQYREYFLKIEEAWNSPEKVMERALQFARQRVLEAERRIFALEEDKESLEIALNESLQFYTVAKYNGVFDMGWNMAQCQSIGKHLSAYCRSRSIEIRRCQTNDERFGAVNSYPLSAWESFLEVTLA